MGARLVGHDLGFEAALQKLGQHVGGIGLQADAEGPPSPLGVEAPLDRVVEVRGDLIQVSRP